MPELPEVETIVRHLSPLLVGRRVRAVAVLRADVVHGDPAPLAELLEGAAVKGVGRRGKRLSLRLDRPLHWRIGLGMSGRLTLHRPEEPHEPHVHAVFSFEGLARELRFRDPRRFGGIWCWREGGPWRGRRIEEPALDPFDMRPRAFLDGLKGRHRPIKSLLMDQRVISGIGNIYADEALHRAGIHPLREAGGLSELEGRGLLAAARAVLRQAIECGGSTLVDYRTAEGGEGGYQRHHRVYGRTGEPCRRCGTFIEQVVLSARSTHFCPTCQPRTAKE